MRVDDELRRAGRDLVDRSGTHQTPDGVRRRQRRRRTTRAALPALAAVAIGLLLWSGSADESSVDTIDTPSTTTTPVDDEPVRIDSGLGPTTVLAADGTPIVTIDGGGFVPGEDDLAIVVTNELLGLGTGAGSSASDAMAAAGLDGLLDDAAEQLGDAGLTIETTLDTDAQDAAGAAIEGANLPGTLSTVLWSIDPMSGATVAVAGPAGTIRREAAGAVRPAMMAVALETGVGADERLENPANLDVPVDGSTWKVQDLETGGTEPITLGQALATGANIPWVGLINDGRVDRTFYAAVAERFGFQGLDPGIPSAVLGSFSTDAAEVARMTAVFATEGSKTEVHMIRRIWTQDRRLVFDRAEQTASPEVIFDRPTVEAVRDAMSDAVCCGTATGASLPGDVAQIGVTGTTDPRNANAWFTGSTPALTTTVWIGAMEGPSLGPIDGEPVTGGGAPATVWARFTAAVGADGPRIFP